MSRRLHFRLPKAGRFIPPIGDELVSIEALSAIVLLGATLAALVWANVDPASYASTWHHVTDIGIGDAAIALDRRAWVDSGLMTIFFFVVGLEVKRELLVGDLRDRRAAALPVIAAIGGMAAPALVYVLVTAGEGGRGWAIPMATDIAFAMGVLALVGARAGSRLKLFLLTLAVADDIGAIVVIAVFYSGGIEVEWLLAALGVVAVIVALRALGAASTWWFVVPAVALWVCIYESGIHATIAGVVLALLTPIRAGDRRPLESLERGLHPWSSFAVVPLFALANAGVQVGGDALERAASSAVTWGVVAGLVVGKTIGIGVSTVAAARAGVGRLPDGVGRVDVWRVAVVAGIGFTVSLFIAGLAFEGRDLADAKIGILTASAVAGAAGTALFLVKRTRSAPPPS